MQRSTVSGGFRGALFRRLGLVGGPLVAMVLLTACASVPSLPPPTAAVRAAMEGFMDALNSLDVEGMAMFFADDITAFVPLAQPERAAGKPAVVEIFRRYVERTRATTPRTSELGAGEPADRRSGRDGSRYLSPAERRRGRAPDVHLPRGERPLAHHSLPRIELFHQPAVVDLDKGLRTAQSPALLAMGLGLVAVGATLAALVFANWSSTSCR
jgi:hypothetical protein